MADISSITDDPEYDRQATRASYASIAVFFGTFLYMSLTSGHAPSALGGLVFSVLGMFAVSLLIAAPFFLLRKKFPRLGVVFRLGNIVTTVVVTRAAFLWLFA